MKKTLLVLAAAAACASAAQAQSNVRITGLADMYIGSMKTRRQRPHPCCQQRRHDHLVVWIPG